VGRKIPVAAIGAAPASADEFQIYTARPDVRFLSRGVQPPSQVYVSVGDDIVVGCASSVANETVTVSYRLLRFDGELVLGQFALHPKSDRSLTVYSESLAEGFLLSVSCKAAAATTRGQTFVRVFLTDPAFGPGQPSYMLMADYVTTAMAPAHPNGRVLAPTEGPGNIRSVAIAAPGAGADFGAPVPVNARWRLISAEALLTTSAAAGVRTALLDIQVPGGGVFVCPPQQNQNPSVGQFYYAHSIVQYAGSVAIGNFWAVSPGIILPTGGAIVSVTLNIGLADQWSNIILMVEEWLDNV